MVLKNEVKDIQATAYNGARMVHIDHQKAGWSNRHPIVPLYYVEDFWSLGM